MDPRLQPLRLVLGFRPVPRALLLQRLHRRDLAPVREAVRSQGSHALSGGQHVALPGCLLLRAGPTLQRATQHAARAAGLRPAQRPAPAVLLRPPGAGGRGSADSGRQRDAAVLQRPCVRAGERGGLDGHLEVLKHRRGAVRTPLPQLLPGSDTFPAHLSLRQRALRAHPPCRHALAQSHPYADDARSLLTHSGGKYGSALYRQPGAGL
mmetsp:Transcript_16905/g.37556  ORF Transcript_16905/g.37556 Transcript_16905/m.37556 type:complete len:209 (-) Transcript_16905:761-1387(-)